MTDLADRLAWATGLEPALVWQEFAALAAIPRRSKQEDAVRQHILGRLAALGFRAEVDRTGNVVAFVPASVGAESAPTVILQAHMDMVCEADADAGSDPAIDGVFPIVAEGWVSAPGTTLGGDDGIGVATALAIAAEAAEATGGPGGTASVARPPLELLFTVDEEMDFTGAAGVDAGLLNGRILLNLDAEDETEVIIGSAGGSRVFLRVAAESQPAPTGKLAVELRVSGLDGGHSGQQIDNNMMNAVKALGFTLAQVAGQLADDAWAQMQVFDLKGGRADNAIPREASAGLFVSAESRQALELAASTVQRRIRAWRAGADDAALVEVVDYTDAPPERVLSPSAAATVVDLLLALPSGVLAVDESLAGIVRTSTNLGVAYIENDDVVLISAPRSSRPVDLDALHARYASFANLSGARLLVTAEYPAWQPDFDSDLLKQTRAAYAEVYGHEPRVTAVHAGLEAGEIASHLPGLAAVSMGPTVLGAHGPGERIEIASVGRFHQLVRTLLARLV